MNAQKLLFTGIYALFVADSGDGGLYDAVGGRLFSHDAPQGVTKPYVVMSLIHHAADWQFNEYYEEFAIQFDCIGATSESVMDLKHYLTLLFDEARPTVTGYTVVSFNRGGDSPDFWEPGSWYMGGSEYNILLEKN